jgi:hypothetical protein
MITVYPVLCQEMRKHGLTYGELATVANVKKSTLYLKICGIKRWKLTEVVNICCFFRTHNAEHLFDKRLSFVRKHYNTKTNKSQ